MANMVILAQGAPLPPTSGIGVPEDEKKVEILSNDMALMVGVGVLALIVLAFFAKRSFGGSGRRRKRVTESRSVPNSSSLPKVESPKENKEGRKRRRRKRSHRPSNPTLGETGGLPPRRAVEDSSGAAEQS